MAKLGAVHHSVATAGASDEASSHAGEAPTRRCDSFCCGHALRPGQATPATPCGERSQGTEFGLLPLLWHMPLPLKLVLPTSLSAWSPGSPGCRQRKVRLAVQESTSSPWRRHPAMGAASPLRCHLPCPLPSLRSGKKRAAADYHHASHIGGMRWKEHYSKEPPTAPRLTLRA